MRTVTSEDLMLELLRRMEPGIENGRLTMRLADVFLQGEGDSTEAAIDDALIQLRKLATGPRRSGCFLLPLP